LQPAAAQATKEVATTEVDTEDFDMLLIDMYYGSASSTAVKTVLCTLLD